MFKNEKKQRLKYPKKIWWWFNTQNIPAKLKLKRNKVLELKSTILKMKNSLDGYMAHLWWKRRINELENRSIEIFQCIEQKEKKKLKKNEESFRNMWNTTNYINMYVMGVPGQEERLKGTEKSIWRHNGQKHPKFDEC